MVTGVGRQRHGIVCADVIDSAGGLIILNTTGKIDINNTFDERLELLSVDALPSVRTTLFGENKNRKFKD